MKSNDYMSGYIDAISEMNENIESAICEMYEYADKKTFKGISRREIVFKCIEIIRGKISHFNDTNDKNIE